MTEEIKGGKYGVEETIDVVDALISFVMAADEAKNNDGKIDWKDLPLLFNPITKIPPALEGREAIPQELGEMDDEDQQKILDFVKNRLNITSDKAEKIVNAAFETLTSGVQLYNAITE